MWILGPKRVQKAAPRNFKIFNKLIVAQPSFFACFCIVLHVGILAMQGNIF